MRQASIDELREAIRRLKPDSKAIEQREFARIVSALKNDIIAAHSRGVTWKSLAGAVAEKTGYRVSASRMRDKIKALPALPEKPEPPAKDEKHGGHFIVAAITPEGELYQLEPSGKGVYAVHGIGEDGSLHICAGSDFPLPMPDRAAAVKRFKAWAKERGFEVYGGE
jgi:hypothetical protein